MLRSAENSSFNTLSWMRVKYHTKIPTITIATVSIIPAQRNVCPEIVAAAIPPAMADVPVAIAAIKID